MTKDERETLEHLTKRAWEAIAPDLLAYRLAGDELTPEEALEPVVFNMETSAKRDLPDLVRSERDLFRTPCREVILSTLKKCV